MELDDLREFADLTYEVYRDDRRKRREVERLVENLANASVDIAKIILAGENLEVPSTYSQVFDQLRQGGVIPASLAVELAVLARTCNALAHQYLDVKWDSVKHTILYGPQFLPDFIKIVEEKLQEE